MSRAEEIIVKHIHELERRCDKELEFQVWAEENDYVYNEMESDDRWREYTNRKIELLTMLAEIRDCDIYDLVLE